MEGLHTTTCNRGVTTSSSDYETVLEEQLEMAALVAADELIDRKTATSFNRMQQTRKVQKIVERMDEEGEIKPGCGICTLLFSRKPSKKSKSVDRLATTGEAVRARADALQAKVDELRQEAFVLNTEGKKKEAVTMLRRSKPIQKQLETALASAEALDLQVLVLEDASLQKEVTSALSASVKKVKRGTKNLLKTTESAVDGAEEVRDLAEDVSQALGGLRAHEDEDDLLDELQSMMMDDAGGPPPLPDSIKTGVAVTEPVAASIPIAQYPIVPTQSLRARKKEEKSGLLSAGV